MMDNQSYQSYGGMDRPLFGESNKKVSFLGYNTSTYRVYSLQN